MNSSSEDLPSAEQITVNAELDNTESSNATGEPSCPGPGPISKEVDDSESSNRTKEPSEAVRVQNAIEMYYESQRNLDKSKAMRKMDAAVIAELPVSTFNHRLAGRRSRAEASEASRRLTPREEELVIWRCDTLAKEGFPQPIKAVREIAQQILRKRQPEAVLGKQWVNKALYKKYPGLKSRWSRQLGKGRVCFLLPPYSGTLLKG